MVMLRLSGAIMGKSDGLGHHNAATVEGSAPEWSLVLTGTTGLPSGIGPRKGMELVAGKGEKVRNRDR